MSLTGCVCLYPAAQGRDKQKNKTEDVFSVGKALLLKGEPTVSNRGNKGTIIEIELFYCSCNHFSKFFVWEFFPVILIRGHYYRINNGRACCPFAHDFVEITFLLFHVSGDG